MKYFLCRNGVDLHVNGVLYMKYSGSFRIATAEQCNSLTDIIPLPFYFNVIPRVLMAFLNPKEMECAITIFNVTFLRTYLKGYRMHVYRHFTH